MQSNPDLIWKEILNRFLDDYLSNSSDFEHKTVSEDTIKEFKVATKVGVRGDVALFIAEISTEERGPALVGACLTEEEAGHMHQSIVTHVADHLESHATPS